jgi:hypothetical protein
VLNPETPHGPVQFLRHTRQADHSPCRGLQHVGSQTLLDSAYEHEAKLLPQADPHRFTQGGQGGLL